MLHLFYGLLAVFSGCDENRRNGIIQELHEFGTFSRSLNVTFIALVQKIGRTKDPKDLMLEIFLNMGFC